MQVLSSNETSWMHPNNFGSFYSSSPSNFAHPSSQMPSFYSSSSSSCFPSMYNSNNIGTGIMYQPFQVTSSTSDFQNNITTPSQSSLVINEQDADDDIVMRDGDYEQEGSSEIVNTPIIEQENIEEEEEQNFLSTIQAETTELPVVPFKLDSIFPFLSKQLYKKYYDTISKLILDGKISPRFSTGTIPLPIPYKDSKPFIEEKLDNNSTPSIIIEEIDETTEVSTISAASQPNKTYTVTESVLVVPSSKNQNKAKRTSRTIHEKRAREENCSPTQSLNNTFEEHQQQFSFDTIKKRKLF